MPEISNELLQQQIDELRTMLETEIASRLSTVDTERLARISQDDALNTSILSEESTRASENAATDFRIDGLEMSFPTLESAISHEAVTRIAQDDLINTRMDYLLASTNTSLGVMTTSLDAETAARVLKDNELEDSINDLNLSITASLAAYTTQLTATEQDLINGITLTNTQVTNLEASLDFETTALSASIFSEQQARVSALEAVSTDITQMNTNFTSLETNVNAAITTEQQTRASATDALAQSISTLTADLDTAESSLSAAITNESTARATENSVLAQQINSLSSTMDGNTALVEQQMQTIDGITASWTIRTDVNGRVAGVSLINSVDEPTKFEITADNFSVLDPTDPLNVVLGVDTQSGEAFVEAAYIRNLVVETLQIGQNAVTVPVTANQVSDITLSGVTLSTITSGSITGYTEAVVATFTNTLATTLDAMVSASGRHGTITESDSDAQAVWSIAVTLNGGIIYHSGSMRGDIFAMTRQVVMQPGVNTVKIYVTGVSDTGNGTGLFAGGNISILGAKR
ncbi:hypothetical protein [Marinobacterium litorale]|uniref:hypothetical protein n=1 Tax=Marinobacterium litorale TaxID=404770 RepID=UPI0004273E43|nr:hypothetical protein [Marinobacterium litorale]